MSETEVSNRVRLAFGQRYGSKLWRNNCGAWKTADGRWIRYGLANESARLSREWKSADLIGWTPVTVTPDMVGSVVAVFTSVEVKASGEASVMKAQERWRDLVNEQGGYAVITHGPTEASDTRGSVRPRVLKRSSVPDAD